MLVGLTMSDGAPFHSSHYQDPYGSSSGRIPYRQSHHRQQQPEYNDEQNLHQQHHPDFPDHSTAVATSHSTNHKRRRQDADVYPAGAVGTRATTSDVAEEADDTTPEKKKRCDSLRSFRSFCLYPSPLGARDDP